MELDGPNNAEVLEVWRSDTATEALKQLMSRYPKCDWYQATQIKTKIHRLNEKAKKLKRNKQDGELKSLLFSHFEIPVSVTSQLEIPDKLKSALQKVQTKTVAVYTENRDLKRDIEHVENTNEILERQVLGSERRVEMLMSLLEITNKKYSDTCKYKRESYQLMDEVDSWERKYEALSKQLDEAVEELHVNKSKLQKESTRNLNKKIKRRDESLRMKDEIITEKEKENLEVKSKAENLKKDKRNLLVKVCRLKRSVLSAQDVCEQRQHEVEDLKLQISDKESQIKELEQTNALLQDPIIETYYGGKYSNEIRETIMTLITECGVSQKKVNQVMQTVVSKLTGKMLSHLPSTGVKSRLMLEAKRVANSQIAAAILADRDTMATLHQDGTSKFHRHFQGFQFTLSDGKSLSAGLSEVAAGDASTLFVEFKHIVSQIASAFDKNNPTDPEIHTAKLISSLIATMSDQGSVNPVFNEKLRVLREELLPVAYENWDNFTQEEKADASKLFSFFCKMHLFVNMATEVDKCLAEFERTVIAEGRNPFSFFSAESGIARLVRTASKAFTTHGCEKSGVGGHFETYLKAKGITNKLITFRGQRFNHLFHAAGVTYYHLDDLKDFLSKWSNQNELLRSVSFDVNETVYVAGIRALGLLDKIVTGPLWRLIENSPNSLSLNNHLYQMKLTLEALINDASPLLNGENMFNEQDVKINKDAVFEALIAPSEDPLLDSYTQMALEICCGGMLIILERQAKDQLPGGKYWGLREDTAQRLDSIPTTNTVSERDFAQLDMLMRSKPSAATTTYEAVIMWSNNETSQWLDSLSEMERNDVLEDARTHAPKMKEMIRAKQAKLYADKLELLAKRQEKKALQDAKQHTNKVRLTHKLTEIGGLWNADDIERHKTGMSDHQFKDAIVCQLQFRRSVIGCKGAKELFQQQHKGQQYNIDQLTENLKRVLELNAEYDAPETGVKLNYKQQDEVQQVIGQLKKTLGGRIEENRKKVLLSQQKELLPLYRTDPTKLIGKKVKHKCRDPDTNIVEWLNAEVINIRKLKEDKTEFTVKYEEDEDLWHFPLLKDMAKGDLIILNTQ